MADNVSYTSPGNPNNPDTSLSAGLSDMGTQNYTRPYAMDNSGTINKSVSGIGNYYGYTAPATVNVQYNDPTVGGLTEKTVIIGGDFGQSPISEFR